MCPDFLGVLQVVQEEVCKQCKRVRHQVSHPESLLVFAEKGDTLQALVDRNFQVNETRESLCSTPLCSTGDTQKQYGYGVQYPLNTDQCLLRD